MPNKKRIPRRSRSSDKVLTKKVGNTSDVKYVRVRMYRQGLGDCFLLSFATDSSLSESSHVLIDCGTLGATTTGVNMADVVGNIASTIKNKDSGKSNLALLAATHEHQDHLSGFNAQKPAFDGMQIDNVWLAWTENSNDPLAQKLAKYRGDLGSAAVAATQALGKASQHDERARAMSEGMQAVLSFFGEGSLGATLAKGVNEAMDYVASRASGENLQYLKPGTYLRPNWIPGVTVFVLGPPYDEKKIKNMGEHGNPELYELSQGSVSGFESSAKLSMFDGKLSEYDASLEADEREQLESSRPFDQRFAVEETSVRTNQGSYYDAKESWRCIDNEWLFSSADLALQLDNLTNNTSLALAFEIGDGGPVILMAADAQLGNWLSWHDYTWEIPNPTGATRKLQAKDLLARTVVYKVGHHSSHNATAVNHGLEMMNDKSLLALIPIDKQVAIKKKWPMPAEKLYERLLEKTEGRVIRSDTGWPEDSQRPKTVSTSEWKKLSSRLKVDVQKEYVDVMMSA